MPLRGLPYLTTHGAIGNFVEIMETIFFFINEWI